MWKIKRKMSSVRSTIFVVKMTITKATNMNYITVLYRYCHRFKAVLGKFKLHILTLSKTKMRLQQIKQVFA